jgi:pimeloyl-ACP methyl ester carboxylesterase
MSASSIAAPDGAELFTAFCQPATRDDAPKITAILDSAHQRRIAHRQILELPPLDRPPIELALYRWGDASRPQVLLTHGWEFQAGRMAAFVQPLLDAGFGVVALDFPAHGRSGGDATTLLDIASSIDEAIQAFGGVHAIIGHSFGAQSAAWLLATRGGLGVQKLVMIAAANSVAYLAGVSPKFASLSPAQIAPLFDEFERRIGAPMTDFDADRVVGGLRVPTLLIHDTRDLMVPYAHGESYSWLIPGAQLMTTNGLGHRSIIRAPEVIAAAVAFVV